MLFSLITLVTACFAFYISSKTGDEIIGLLIKLSGLFSLLLSIVYSFWFIKLLIILVIFLTPNLYQHNPQRSRFSSYVTPSE